MPVHNTAWPPWEWPQATTPRRERGPAARAPPARLPRRAGRRPSGARRRAGGVRPDEVGVRGGRVEPVVVGDHPDPPVVDGGLQEREHVCLTVSFNHDLADGGARAPTPAPVEREARTTGRRATRGPHPPPGWGPRVARRPVVLASRSTGAGVGARAPPSARSWLKETVRLTCSRSCSPPSTTGGSGWSPTTTGSTRPPRTPTSSGGARAAGPRSLR